MPPAAPGATPISTLAIDAGRRLTLDEMAALAEAFSDSDLPYNVDLVDWETADNRWRGLITAEGIPLTDATKFGAACIDSPGLGSPASSTSGGWPFSPIQPTAAFADPLHGDMIPDPKMASIAWYRYC